MWPASGASGHPVYSQPGAVVKGRRCPSCQLRLPATAHPFNGKWAHTDPVCGKWAHTDPVYGKWAHTDPVYDKWAHTDAVCGKWDHTLKGLWSF